ncbi:hypothetical protein GCM10022226_28230 [Sphaerisporangium flaviroseum]|uniref:Uncharacterized protein n=1 Tax=Sphaerisporangium flaviroseum TaxID=509199 RepID=A0ABP7I530_9ACTN
MEAPSSDTTTAPMLCSASAASNSVTVAPGRTVATVVPLPRRIALMSIDTTSSHWERSGRVPLTSPPNVMVKRMPRQSGDVGGDGPAPRSAGSGTGGPDE